MDGKGLNHRADAFIRSLNLDIELSKKRSIYRVPTFMREQNKEAFTPHVVSFGPYHCGEDHLMPMEEHKIRAFHNFLTKVSGSMEDLESAAAAVLPLLQDSYASLGKESRVRERDMSLMRMILDGCFMLEVLRVTSGSRDYYAPDDPLFSEYGMPNNLAYIRRDMLLIENQLPLLVIKMLLYVEGSEGDDISINRMVLDFCAGTQAWIGTPDLGLHPLDVYRKSMLGGHVPKFDRPLYWVRPLIPTAATPIPTAHELQKVGVRFSKSRSSDLGDIRFEGRTLVLPAITVDRTTESIFLNLVAFEHLHLWAGSDITTYVSFMDEIIDTAEDVRLLNEGSIIDNGLGSYKAVATLFNGLSKGVPPQSGHEVVRRAVSNYYQKERNKRRKRWWSDLMDTYFKNPWSIASVAAAIILLLVTITQTLYAILAYHLPPHT